MHVHVRARAHTQELTVTIPDYSGLAAKLNLELSGCCCVAVVVAAVVAAIYRSPRRLSVGRASFALYQWEPGGGAWEAGGAG